ncbi:MAG: tetratricopeptide repeat protein [Terracidiphilus sp.]
MSLCILATAILGALPVFCQQPADSLTEVRKLLDAGKLSQSESALRNYLLGSPSSAEGHFLLGYVLFRERKAKESLGEFTLGAKYQRPPADDLKVVGSDYVLLGDYGDADKWFSEVVVEKPDDADTWYLLGRTKFNESDFTAAKSSFERALALHPKYVEAENNIGLSWRELNNSVKAQAAFQTAIDWQGDAPADAQPFLNLGTLLFDNNEFDKAIPYLTKAATLSPNNPKIHEELSQVYTAQQDLPNAQAELVKAIALAPGTSALHFKLGQVYRKEGLHDLAQHEFDICSKLSSTHSSTSTPNPPPLPDAQPR